MAIPDFLHSFSHNQLIDIVKSLVGNAAKQKMAASHSKDPRRQRMQPHRKLRLGQFAVCNSNGNVITTVHRNLQRWEKATIYSQKYKKSRSSDSFSYSWTGKAYMSNKL
jgi:hypothetical protein